MLELRKSVDHLTQEEVSMIQREMQKNTSHSLNVNMNVNINTRKSPEPSPAVHDIKKRYRYKQEMETLSNFMLRNFCAAVLIKHSKLLVPTDDGESQAQQQHVITLAELLKFLRTLLARVRATRQQFNKMCVMSIKFLGICSKSQENYMRFLKYDVRKLVVTCLLLTFPHNSISLEQNSPTWDQQLLLLSRATGLPKEQLRHCCEIVGPILKSQYLKTQRAVFRHAHAQAQAHSFDPNDRTQNRRNKMKSGDSVDIRSTNFGTFTNYYTNTEDLDPDNDQELYCLPSDYESFNEMGRKLVNKNFLVK
ncbi:hypothetical protein KLU848_2581 [Kluyveromyces marxianus]|uniref:YPL039W n=1 Tax=Kluyveromyces marxianus TaxID=4911 RepID=A0ABX6EYB0_KLUMA|nr:YPL039W [Kluyveromyces marxianus]BAP73122.1 uncharacterized protein YPL039W [Kluyveromyces marxianus]